MIIQIFLSLFILFAISRVIFQLRSSKISIGAFLFWGGLFVVALIGVIDPGLTTYVAVQLGIGRGADVVIYISIALIFYLIFRLSISIEEIHREISLLVRKYGLDREEILKLIKHKRG